MSSFTPGPWVRDGFNLARIIRCTAERGSPEATHACGDYEDIATAHGKNWEANARLIAAAPDLLEALKSAEGILTRSGYTEWQGGSLAEIRAAIAKAEGRS